MIGYMGQWFGFLSMGLIILAFSVYVVLGIFGIRVLHQLHGYLKESKRPHTAQLP